MRTRVVDLLISRYAGREPVPLMKSVVIDTMEIISKIVLPFENRVLPQSLSDVVEGTCKDLKDFLTGETDPK